MIKTDLTATGNTVSGIPEAICSGGYPEPNARTASRARRWYRQYLDAITQRDVSDVSDVATVRDKNNLSQLMNMLAYRTANLLNISSLSGDLGIDRQTAEKYTGILEQLFLVRRLPAWHSNRGKRLVRTPKVHVIDSGLAATLNRLTTGDWQSQSTDFGALLESFVVQQLIGQAGWVDNDLTFSHYRDKDKVEVDLVIEQGRKVWGVEVKRAATLRKNDGAGLARIAAQAGKHFQGGILLYSGVHCLSLKTNSCFAVPLNKLWT